jgi:hypothetical protein
MSRGGMLLRAARAGVELGYTRVGGAERRGRRAARLDPASGERRGSIPPRNA